MKVDKYFDLEQFKVDCKTLGVKYVAIDLQRTKQLMTSSTGIYEDGYMDVANELLGKSYVINRIKVEKYPDKYKRDENFIYYESHLRLKLPISYDLTKLDPLCKKFNLHKSRNLFKKSKEFKFQMLTYRSYTDDYKKFSNHITRVQSALNTINVVYDKVEIEECVYDSNEKLDEQWLSERNTIFVPS